MGRYTLAYRDFRVELKEIDLLRKFAASREAQDPVKLRHEINALCRGAVVLLCSHLESYVKQLGELALDSMHVKAVPRGAIASQLYYHISKDRLDEIRDTADPERIATKVFDFLADDLRYWSKTGPFPTAIPVDRFNKGFSNPAFPKIKAYFNRFGYAHYANDLAGALTVRFNSTVNMVNHLVDTRNKIAHGDSGATKTPLEIEQMMAIIQDYCRTTDDLFARWWKAGFCSIR